MKFDTILPADSVEFCPHAEARNIFACGMYQLDEPKGPAEPEVGSSSQPLKQKRLGKCMIFEVPDQEGYSLQPLDEFPLPAILDMKWCHATQSEDGPLLAIADAEGRITLYYWNIAEHRMELRQTIHCASSDVLCLSLDWSNRRNSNDLGSLIVSRSDGYLSLIRPIEGHGLAVSDSWHAHDFEPWIAAWNYWDVNVLYSGGDDLKLKGWDVRQGFTQATFTNTRFDAGVTTIQSNPHVEHLIAVGSYDNSVRLYDVRKVLVPLTEADVGGGAWRVKWHPDATRKADLLVACMHDGCKIIQFSSGVLGLSDGTFPDSRHNQDPVWKVMKRFDEHESLAYGADWSYAKDRGSDSTLVASCSFYDHALRVWKG